MDGVRGRGAGRGPHPEGLLLTEREERLPDLPRWNHSLQNASLQPAPIGTILPHKTIHTHIQIHQSEQNTASNKERQFS